MSKFTDMTLSNGYAPDDLMPIGDVARAFGVTVATIRNWEARGTLSGTRTPGGQRRFRRSDVEALLAGPTS